MIEDGGIVVLGGLIEDSSIKGETRVPFLGRIPIIGLAFKTRNASATKNNLMVFIRPKILRDGVQTSFETDAKYNYIRDEQKKMNKTEILPLLPGAKKPSLDPPPPPPPPGTGEVDPRVEQEKLRGGQGDATRVQSPAAPGQPPRKSPGATPEQPQGAPAPQATPAQPPPPQPRSEGTTTQPRQSSGEAPR
jgi:general secretion pathway protein D